jgi:hypothetical protein
VSEFTPVKPASRLFSKFDCRRDADLAVPIRPVSGARPFGGSHPSEFAGQSASPHAHALSAGAHRRTKPDDVRRSVRASFGSGARHPLKRKRFYRT